MKILIVIDNLASGGAQRVQISLALALINKGHVVEFFTYKKEDFFKHVLRANNIKIFSTEKKIVKGFSIATLKRLRSVIVTNSYDGVISSLHAPSVYAALAMAGVKKGKLIVCEESSSNAPVNPIRKFLFYLASLSSDSVVTKTFDEAKLLGRWPGLSHKIHPIWNGFKISSFKNKNIINNKVLKLLVVGRIAYPKNGVNLLRALSLFYERNGAVPNIDWAGRRDDDKRSIEMQRQMDQFLFDHPKIASSWTWLGEVNNVSKLYREHDALILMSIYEALPAVIMEAMIEGCFVIASDICDNGIVIGNEERGLLCEPLSPKSICDAIERLYAMSSDEKKKKIMNARKYAELHFNSDNMASSFESLF
jgi:glycosyltransferase involved in cell wall biosynthesis